MNITKQDIDQLNAKIVIDISKEDYTQELDDKLKEYRKTAKLKGFRIGKTPMGFVKKVYGQGALQEIVLKKVNDSLNDYIKDNDIKLVGYPLASEDQPKVDFDIKNPDNYSFSFDLGILLDVDIKGIDSSSTYDYDEVVIPEEEIEKELEKGQKQLGKYVEVEDDILEDDKIHIDAEELDGKNVKVDGWASSFDILAGDISDEKIKKEVLKNKKGHVIKKFDIYNMDKHLDEKGVKKYLLEIKDEEVENVEVGNSFSGTISKVERLEPREIDTEFFEKFFGPDSDIDSIEKAKDKIRADFKTNIQSNADKLLFNEMYKSLIAENVLELPTAFIERWLKQEHAGHDHDIDVEGFEKSLTWSVVLNKIIDTYKVEVKQEDVIHTIRQQVNGMLGQYAGNEQFVEMYMKQFMENKESVDRAYQETLSQKAFEALKENVSLNAISIAKDKFVKKIEDENTRLQEKQELENHSHAH